MRRSRTPPARSSSSRSAPNPDGTGARTVQVVPIANEAALRNRAWVEGNLKKVDAASGGTLAYVYVPDTGNQGHDYFKRYFFPQAHKDAIIVDERFNGGGQFRRLLHRHPASAARQLLGDAVWRRHEDADRERSRGRR